MKANPNPFLVAIGRADGPHTARLALLFLVRASMRLREHLRPTPRQAALELAASTYPLPKIGSVAHTKRLLAARTRGLLNGDLSALTVAGHEILSPFDQGVA